MGRYIDEKTFKADMAELTAYRATGLSPEQVAAMADPAPAPLYIPPDEEDGFSAAAGILVDDGYDPAMEAPDAYLGEQWTT